MLVKDRIPHPETWREIQTKEAQEMSDARKRYYLIENDTLIKETFSGDEAFKFQKVIPTEYKAGEGYIPSVQRKVITGHEVNFYPHTKEAEQ